MRRLIGFAFLCLLLMAGCGKKTAPGQAAEVTGGEGPVVELRSGVLAVFDVANEPVRCSIPDFSPGLYRVPVTAIRSANDNTLPSSIIYVDSGTLFFVDADFYDKLRGIENRLFEETKDSFQLNARHDEVSKELGIRYAFIESPGIGSGVAFEGDGAYTLDISQVRKVSER